MGIKIKYENDKEEVSIYFFFCIIGNFFEIPIIQKLRQFCTQILCNKIWRTNKDEAHSDIKIIEYIKCASFVQNVLTL